MSEPVANLEAEEHVLGALILAPAPERTDAVLRILGVEDFYREQHRVIFTAIRDLRGNGDPIEIVTVANEIRRGGRLDEVGGQDAIAALQHTTPVPGNAEHYATLVKEAAQIRAVHRLGKQLLEVSDLNGNTAALVDQVSTVLGATQTGSRQLLRTLDVEAMVDNAPREIPWAIENLTADSYLTMLSGKEGTGKSLLSMSLTQGVAKGERTAGMSCKPGSVLVVDAENGEYEIHRRVRNLGLPKEGVTLVEADGFHLGRDLGRLEELIEVEQPRLVILDSFRSLWPGGDENDTAAVTAVLDPLRNLFRRQETAGLLLHHVARSANDYRGSSAIGASVDLGFVLSRHPEDPESRERRRLVCWKCRPAPEPSVRWLRLHFERGQVYVEESDGYDEPIDGEQKGKPRTELYPAAIEAAADAPIGLTALAKALGKEPKSGTVRRIRDDLVNSGELIQGEDGKVKAAEGAIEGGTLGNGLNKPDPPGVPECQDPYGGEPGGTTAQAPCPHPGHRDSDWVTDDGLVRCGICHPRAGESEAA